MCFLAVFVAVAEASAHVGPSETVNNRYYKLTPMADRVRIVYTIFFGRDPGADARRQMDMDRDGLLSSPEVSAWSADLQTRLETAALARLDGNAVDIRWKPIELGMDTFTTGGGAFSADLIGTVCLERGDVNREHRFLFADTLKLPKPGETELRLDPAPGIRISRNSIGGRDIGLSGHKWQGGPGPAQHGYQLHFFVESAESAGLDDVCKPPPKERSLLWLTLLGGGAALVLLAGTLVWRRLKR